MAILHWLSVAIVASWTLLDLIALLFGLWSAVRAWRARAVVRAAGQNGALRLSTGQALRNALIRACLFASLLSVGLESLPANLAAPVPSHLPAGWLRPFLVSVVFIVASAALMVAQILDNRDARRLLDYLQPGNG